jgi:protoporphyrinogen oxidase
VSERFVVIGGGVAGLTLADALATRGARVTLLEAEPEVGGLIRTDRRGGFTADRLIHRLVTYDQRVLRFLETLAGDRLFVTAGAHRVHWRGRLLGASSSFAQALGAIGAAESARLAADYTVARLAALVRQPADATLADWLAARFGKTFHDRYLGPYLEKVWGLPATRLSADWGRRRVAAVGLADALRAFAVGNRTDGNSRFLSLRGGVATLARLLAERAAGRGVEIRTGSAVARVLHDESRVRAVVTSAGTEIAGDRFVATLAPGRLARLLDPPPREKVLAAAALLRHRAIVTVQLEIGRSPVTGATSIQFPAPEFPFARVGEPSAVDPSLAPAERSLLSAEIYCDPGDATWTEPDDSLAARCAKSLVRAGILREGDVTGSAVHRTADASPVYALGYAADLTRVADALARLENLTLVGRTAAFSFANVDEVIEEALTVAPVLLRGGRYRPV